MRLLGRVATAILGLFLAAGPGLAQNAGLIPVNVPQGSVNALDARIVGDDKETRLIIDVSDKVDFAVFPLSDPYRLIVDLSDVRFSFREGTGSTGRGLISAFRYGQISKGKSRIVLDLSKPALASKVSLQPAAAGQPVRLVIDVEPANRDAFLSAVQKYRDTQAVAPRNDQPATRPKDGRLRIVLDPGHGGIDAGTRGSGGTLEKEVVLAFAKLLSDMLVKSGKYEVFLTRTDDSFLKLAERVDYARKHDADLFISIHADSYRADGAVRGAAVYTLSDKASDAMVASIADHENKSDARAGVDAQAADTQVADILLDLTMRETKNFSIVFARDLVNEMKADVKLTRIPHQQAGFHVLKAPDIPSALIELGFLSNRDDEKLLKQADWQEKTARSIQRAIDGYFAGRDTRKAGP